MTAIRVDCLLNAVSQEQANIIAVGNFLGISFERFNEIIDDTNTLIESTGSPEELLTRIKDFLNSKHYIDAEATLFGLLLSTTISKYPMVKFGKELEQAVMAVQNHVLQRSDEKKN